MSSEGLHEERGKMKPETLEIIYFDTILPEG